MVDNKVIKRIKYYGYVILIISLVFIFLVTIVFALPKVFALECNYDNEPLLTKEINWDCELNNKNEEFKCYSYVLWNDLLISAMPIEEDVKLYGRVDYFSGKGLVNIYFSKQDLYEGLNYTFGVKCASNNFTEEFSAGVVPVYSELREVPYRGIWFKENMAYFIGLLVIIMFILILWKVIKG